ncbi:tetratricopeptide repeat protein [Cytobacillus sp. S13-E01]|uniref:tetratricopeptide repeat protein n=1 Tax=Cytobacillus sp. S13-E01 TaxID=3031326 RepID=UPI0023D89305|nr:tetratricopeptide repeat protein [Cytobacillus sp. S13-E01]MDF0725811.1 tetratricopeptide repeat protein [Cytobacillus sp. S13-E01]
MLKVGRNDLCTCGSGEKYKKCCGKKTVVSMELLIEKELHDIQLDIIHFSMKNYQEDMDDYLEQCYEEFDIPDDAIEMFRFFGYTWFITSVKLDGKTIMEEYIDRHLHKFNRPRIKDIVRLWGSARPSVSTVKHQDNQYITIQDLFTKEVKKVKSFDEEHTVEAGGLILGTSLPSGETSVFFTTFLDLPASESEEMENSVLKLFKNSEEESPIDFMASSFLEVLDLFLFGKDEISIDDIEWISPKHKEVAENFREYVENDVHEDTVITLGFYLWHNYCMRRNPTIKKSAVYEAALVYLVDRLQPFGGLYTQKELAEEFNVSSSSISSKYKDLEYVLSDEIENLQDAVENIDFDFEDIYGEDFDDDEDDVLENNNVDNAFVSSKITMERELLNLEREMDNRDFNSIDEVKDFMNKRINNPKSSQVKLSNKEKAQDLLFNAYETNGNKRQQLAKKALKLYPNSPDAYTILAEDETDPAEQQKLYLLGMEAGEKELGQAFFSENKGHFWGIVSTRPYMRAKYNYGMLLHDIGMLEEAIRQYEELLELNPNDNQAVRYELFIAYVENGMIQEAESLLNQYNEEITAHGTYNKLLVEYLKNGPSNKAKKLLKTAKDKNPYVIDYLIRKKKLPVSTPATYGLGEESEAIIYAEQHLHVWQEYVELIDWLKKN